MGLTGLLNETLSSLTGRMAGPRFSVIEPAGKGAVANGVFGAGVALTHHPTIKVKHSPRSQ